VTGHLSLIIAPNESLYIGEALIRCKVRDDGKIQVYIECPKDIPILRESAIKKVAS